MLGTWLARRQQPRSTRTEPITEPGTLSTNQEAASTIQVPAAIIRATGHDILRAARIIPRHGPIILAPGVVIHVSDPVIQASGFVIRASGSVIRTSGSVIRASGSVIRASGFVIRASGAIIQRAGHVFIMSVSTIGATGRISPTIGCIRRAIRDCDDAARLSRCYQIATDTAETAEHADKNLGVFCELGVFCGDCDDASSPGGQHLPWHRWIGLDRDDPWSRWGSLWHDAIWRLWKRRGVPRGDRVTGGAGARVGATNPRHAATL